MPFHIFNGIICGPCGPGSFAVQFGDHLRSGIICGSIWGSFAVRDHLRFNLGIICDPGSFAVQFGDHLLSGVICGSIWGSFVVRDHLRSCTVPLRAWKPDPVWNKDNRKYIATLCGTTPVWGPCLKQGVKDSISFLTQLSSVLLAIAITVFFSATRTSKSNFTGK